MNGQNYLVTKFWLFAAFHWVDVHNRTPNESSRLKSPWELITGEALSVANQFMFKFGEPVCVPIVEPEKQWRFDSKNDIGIYVGQPEETVYSGRVYFPWTGKVLVRGSLSKIVVVKDAIK